MIPNDFIDEVLARTDIVEVIQPHVTLKKTGQNYSGLCPFHNEKSPSFSVSRDKQFYYCFGCQASGSALKFLMEFERLDFVAAVEQLAGAVGMTVPSTDRQLSPEKNQRRKSLYNILEQAAGFFQQQLKSHSGRTVAVDYLKGRGLSGEIARDFGLGYAPPGWDNLYRDQARTNLEHDLLIESGMVIHRPGEADGEDDKTYDRFRDRIMFPIRDIRGRVIAFGGRILGDGQPKYLNSPETPVFHKGRELYGLYEARRDNRKLTQLLVVEGYMDVVALAQHGIRYGVATLGTATSHEHLERIYRLVSRLVFCFDGDNAGRSAAWKALTIALPLMRDGRSARFLFLPDGEDPDSLVRSEGQDKFEWRLEQAQPLADVFFDRLQADIDASTMDGKAALSSTAMPLINQIPAGVFRQLMIQRLSELTGLASEQLLAAAASAPPARGYARSATDTGSQTGLDYGGQYDDRPEPGYGYDGGYNSAGGYEKTSGYGNGHLGAAMPQEDTSEAGRLALAAVAMLLRQPELCQGFEYDEYARLADDSRCALLLEVLAVIHEADGISPVLLLANWQDRAEFDLLRGLLEQEHLLDVSALPEEYAGVIQRLLMLVENQSAAQQRQILLAKPFEQMTEAERVSLKDLVKARKPRH